ncbi:bombesin receptor subtype-3-like [Maniola hyperantus]|uniref:bombesin receptor subtype-3-like n=1 Tax=Aphantopus hyperantus TaxID=2795564 RepID=UPI0021443105
MRSLTADAMAELAPAHGPLFPPLVVAIYIACVAGAGVLANCALLAALLKRSRNGLSSIIIQLAVADIILIATSVGPEIWSYNARSWIFGRNFCIAYRGLCIFASTASLYLIATIALHTLATAKLEEKAITLKNKRSDRDDDDEIRSSRHSLVASSDTSTPPRTMNVDYRLAHTRVPVAPPSVFVWVLSASLSIPEFTLATTVRRDQDVIACTLVDTSHRVNMYSMVAFFNFFLLVLILTSACVLIICKFKSKKTIKLEGSDTIPALKLSLWLILVYGIFCIPRSLFYVYGLYSADTKIDLEYASDNFLLIKLILSAMYLAATLLRPILCLSLLPGLLKMFSFGFRSIDEV